MGSSYISGSLREICPNETETVIRRGGVLTTYTDERHDWRMSLGKIEAEAEI